MKFDPKTQFADALAEIGQQVLAVRANLERLEWLRDKIAQEFADVQRRADEFQVLTEEQAAVKFGVTTDQLGRLRRRHNLPHVNIGRAICYTQQNLADICEIFTLNKRPTAVRKAAA